VEPDDIGGAGRLTFDEMQRVDAALRLVLGLRRQSLIGTGWNALRQSCTYAVTANAPGWVWNTLRHTGFGWLPVRCCDAVGSHAGHHPEALSAQGATRVSA